jgi:hypothetical protein
MPAIPPTEHPRSTTASTSAAPASAVWTADRIRALGAVADMATAASILGVSRALAYQLAKAGRFPVPVLKIGSRYRVPITGLLDALNLPAPEPPAADLTTAGRHASITTARSEADPAATATSGDERTS